MKCSSKVAKKCDRCTCHDLSFDDFRDAVIAGAASPKACFRYHGLMPKCGKCVLLVREALAEKPDEQVNTKIDELK